MSTEVKKGRKPNPPSPSVGNAFLVLRVYIDDHKSLPNDEEVGDRSLKTAKKRAIELYTANTKWARIEAIAQKLDGSETILFTMCYFDAYPFFIEIRDVDDNIQTYRYSTRKEAQAAHAEFDKLAGGVSLTNAFDRTVKSN